MFAQSETFYNVEVNRLDSIYSDRNDVIQITDNKSRVFLCLLSCVDEGFDYKFRIEIDKPWTMERENLKRILTHLKEEQEQLPKQINSYIYKKLGGFYEINKLPGSGELALAAIHILNPTFGYFDFKALCEHYISIIKSKSIDSDFYEIPSNDAHCFVCVLDDIKGNKKYDKESFNPMYLRIHKAEFERLIAWCTDNYSNPHAWEIFSDVYSKLHIEFILYEYSDTVFKR